MMAEGSIQVILPQVQLDDENAAGLQYNLVHRMPQSCTASALLLKDFQPSEQHEC